MARISINEIAVASVHAAKEEKILTRVIDDLKFFNSVLDSNPDLIGLLQDGMLDFEKRREALIKTVGDELHEYSINAICLLIQNHSLNEYSGFIQALETQSRELANHYECTVISAIDLDEQALKQIQQILENKWNGTVRLQNKVDPQIIGGLVIKCGDWQFQSTIQSKLQQLHNHLAFTE